VHGFRGLSADGACIESVNLPRQRKGLRGQDGATVHLASLSLTIVALVQSAACCVKLTLGGTPSRASWRVRSRRPPFQRLQAGQQGIGQRDRSSFFKARCAVDVMSGCTPHRACVFAPSTGHRRPCVAACTAHTKGCTTRSRERALSPRESASGAELVQTQGVGLLPINMWTCRLQMPAQEPGRLSVARRVADLMQVADG
jgi:hypothetical protein